MIENKELKELTVLFLTDGEDLGKSKTDLVIQKLKQEMRAQEIISKFSVLGISDLHAQEFC